MFFNRISFVIFVSTLFYKRTVSTYTKFFLFLFFVIKSRNSFEIQSYNFNNKNIWDI